MAVYVSDRRLWLTVDGKVVEDDDPDAHTLLTSGPGKKMPEARARALGLIVDQPTPPEDAVTDLADQDLPPDMGVATSPDLDEEGREETQEVQEPQPEDAPPSRRRR